MPTGIAPIFCTCYVDPNVTVQKGQEATIAKYPLIVVGAGRVPTNSVELAWKNKIKALNPNIKMLGYVLGAERTNQNNPGKVHWDAVPRDATHDCNYLVNGVPFYPTVNGFHVFDYRTPEYKAAFIAACEATLSVWPFDGLYLDQCIVYDGSNPDSAIREEMWAALQDCITAFRILHPGILFVGNSSRSFTGLNGELNEGRLNSWSELAPIAGQSDPLINIAQCFVTVSGVTQTPVQIEAQMNAALALGAFYAIAPIKNNYQTILWYDFFDSIIAAYTPPPPAPPLPLRIRIV